MSTLQVGVGEQYLTIASVIAASAAGDTILVQAGTYTNDFFTISHNITLQSVGGLANLVATIQPPNGKAIVTVDASATINGFGFTGAAVGDNNGAGIRYEAGDMVVSNSVFWNNQDGILATPLVADTGTILIQSSEFSHNGAGDGFSHNLYVGAIAALTIQGSYFHDAVVGHEIKSRAYSTTIIGNRIQDLQGDGSYSIDLPDGGTNIVQNNVIEKGVNTPNWIIVHLGGEGAPYAGSSLVMTGNTIINDNPNGNLLSDAANAPVTLANNQIWGIDAAHIDLGGPVTQTNNTTLSTRPTLDLTSMAPVVVPTPPAPSGPDLSSGTSLLNWGVAGAVKASGHVLTVGATGEFQSLASALAASVDGDTILVAAGTYTNDFGTVNHKVIIEGVGGIATFVQQNVYSAPTGILVVNADVTLKNLAFTGATNWGGREGGVAVQSGNVTVDNSLFYGNDISIATADNASINLAIYGSEIGANGNAARGTNNLNVGAINSVTIQGSYIHGGTTGQEIFDHAFNTLIQNNVIADGTGGTSSFLIDLGLGGAASIQNNVLDKGASAANGILIHTGGEGAPYANTSVQVTNNTLISEINNTNRPYTYFVVGDTNIAATATTVAGNTFVGGLAGSMQAINATATANTTAPSATVSFASPVSAVLAPALFTAATGPDTLSLSLSETRSDVDAQFVATLDGVAIGGGVITATHGTDPSQIFNFQGSWGAGAHHLGVTIINPKSVTASAYALFVDAATYDGFTVSPAIQVDGYTPTTTLTVGSAANSIVLHMSEDAYLGDAQFTISVDGTQIGGIRTVTALHSLGQSQAVVLSGPFSNAAHTVAVTFLNDAYGGPGLDRNVYVGSIDVNGTANATASAVLLTNGTATMIAAGAPATATAPVTTLTTLTPVTNLAPAAPVADTLTLHMAEDAYLGDAQFTVAVDGVAVGGVMSTNASHILGQSQAITLSGMFGAGTHKVAVSFINDAYGGPGLDRNLYVDSIDFNGAANPLAAANLFSNGTSTLSVTGPAASGAATNTISLMVSEDAYLGDAQFTVTVDGNAVGGLYTATASHILGQSQAVTIAGNYGAGLHTVAVAFVNDAYGGPGLDRNLYVQSVSMGGVASATTNVPLFSNGVASFAVQGAAPLSATAASNTLVLHLSEDMFQGDAQFIVAVDGKTLGPAQTVTASHSLGQTQDFTYAGTVGVGPHDVAVTFLNDAYAGPGQDRNLYVNSIDLNGVHFASATANLFSNGTAHMQVGVLPAS